MLGNALLTLFYNDGHRGTGTAGEMALDEAHAVAESVERAIMDAVPELAGVMAYGATEREAVAKWRRAQLTSAQLMAYIAKLKTIDIAPDGRIEARK